jgi:hypothetical protein
LGRQAQWLEKIGEFDFEIVYVPGSENMLANALSRIYSNEGVGTVWSKSEYSEYHDYDGQLDVHEILTLLLTGVKA